jgi:UDP:flavonoid glycosyltransferase YjiC (YdhE family)
MTTFGTLGDVHPLIALAIELRRRGHTPVFAISEIFRPKIEPLSFELCPVHPFVSPDDRKLIAMLFDIYKGTERTLREILFPALQETYDDLLAAVEGTKYGKPRADLLLTGELIYAGPIVAEKTGVSWASYVLAPLSYFSAFDPPVLPPYPFLAKIQPWLPGSGRLIAGLARWVTRNWCGPIYKLRASLGLPPGTNPLFDAKHSPNLALAIFSPTLGTMQEDWPDSAVQTGFVFYDGDAGKQNLSPELQKFMDSGPAPVVFTLGSAAVLDAGNFYIESSKAAEALGVRAVLLIGMDDRYDPRNQGHPIPDSIFVSQYAPYSKLFSNAAAIVHQGGVGTVAQALRAGKPMLVMPYSHDQPDNARRVRRLGVARVLNRKDYIAPNVTRELGKLLSNPRYARRAESIGFELRHEDGITTACDAIEDLLRKTSPLRKSQN